MMILKTIKYADKHSYDFKKYKIQYLLKNKRYQSYKYTDF